MTAYPQKITFGELRAFGVREVRTARPWSMTC